MSLKKVEQVKKDRFFKIWDILIYGIIAAVIVALFLAVTLTADKSSLSGIEGYYNNNLAFTYNFAEDELKVVLTDNIKVEENNSDTVKLLFVTDGGSLTEHTDYNIIEINKSARSVRITESDCSNRKDCVYSPAITNSAGLIVCSPHRLRILPADYEDDGQTLPIG